ncbi:MAG: cyclic nucleotide-binding domain-containing protein [Opitutae bacterium]|jgi:CRP-like cAMP-binding protein|nr:cyclic nucleotide-binding domain-containing protein [Opitutae bacterium]
MKLLHREDVLEAGHDLPTTGLCANIGTEEMDELKFGGEWILAEDETLVADGHEQRYLYMVVMGEVGIFKANDQGKSQHIATLSTGAAFGEMAFLSGGVASASVQAVGECILWRLDHERLIEFIGEHGAAGGQLCLNVASILSGRLVEGNGKVVEMGKELQASLGQLQQVASAGTQKDQALRQMQGKVANMQNAFKGSAVQKKGNNWFAIAASAVAFLSTAGLVAMFVATEDPSVQQGEDLSQEVEELKANEEFYLGLKQKLEAENKNLVQEKSELAQAKDELSQNIAKLMSSEQALRDDVRGLERKLSDARDDIVRAGSMAKAQEKAATRVEKEVDQTESDAILAWARRNTTLVFPVILKALKPVTLQDRGQQVKIPVPPGAALRASRFHPTAPDYLIVSQPNSDKFLATMPIVNGNFVEIIKPKYESHMSRVGSGGNPLFVPSKKKPPVLTTASPAKLTGSLPTASSISNGMDSTKSMNPAPILTARAKNPQKPANILDNMSTKTKKKEDTSDHGPNCVCRDCRTKKMGKGGSLFPDL